jgi:hypothetical protein
MDFLLAVAAADSGCAAVRSARTAHAALTRAATCGVSGACQTHAVLAATAVAVGLAAAGSADSSARSAGVAADARAGAAGARRSAVTARLQRSSGLADVVQAAAGAVERGAIRAAASTADPARSSAWTGSEAAACASGRNRDRTTPQHHAHQGPQNRLLHVRTSQLEVIGVKRRIRQCPADLFFRAARLRPPAPECCWEIGP